MKLLKAPWQHVQLHLLLFKVLLMVLLAAPLMAGSTLAKETGAPGLPAVADSYWGFYAHRLINRTAVFLLPPEMFGFYKKHILFLAEKAVLPDARRYVVKGEAPRHFIDLDAYGDSALYKLPRRWHQAVEKVGEDSLMEHGIAPWHIYRMKYRLTEAFRNNDAALILKLSAETGHYVADANVPLHTTSNYNGQLTGQYGIHGLWESRLPELYSHGYSLFFEEKAAYLHSPLQTAWQAVANANLALDSVFAYEIQATNKVGEQQKYGFEERLGRTTRVYSEKFCREYHRLLSGQVERRLKASVKMVADFWFTCWVDAGQPDLENLKRFEFTPEQLEQQQKEAQLAGKDSLPTRTHETFKP